MALVNTVEKRIKMQKDGVIKYQIITFCFLNDLQLSKSDLECLLELAKKGSINPNMKIQVDGQILLDFKILGTTDEIGR
jgi:hypothetical protein